MLFHSATFLVFFAAFLVGFVVLKGYLRILYTATASFVFYAWWNPSYLVLLAGFTLIAYFGARVAKSLPRPAFAALIAATLAPLCFFKYTGFLLANIGAFTGTHPNLPSWQLPLGISFISFTVIAYLVDVRRGHYPAEGDFSRVALYLSFFPHLIAGPIMRPRELFPQFTHLRFKRSLVKIGVLLFSVGMIKKTLVADQLSGFVDAVYSSPAPVNALQSLVAFYAFPVQIYCDFSGYTDMALGLALILGIRLPLNFNRPYVSASAREFWRRWHITLSRWLRDYLYIPLGGSRHGKGRMAAALMMTMLLGGLWHGASWMFVLWGAYHGIWLVIEHFTTRKPEDSPPNFMARLITFHLVAIGWILFRARNAGQAMTLVTGFTHAAGWNETMGVALFPAVLITAFFVLHRWDRVSYCCWLARKQRTAVIYGISAALILIGVAMSVGSPNAFIYFDF